jgi:hypothetical protein
LSLATFLVTGRFPVSRALTAGGRFGLVALIVTLFALLGSYDPDYEAYRFVYEFAWEEHADIGRDPAFAFLLQHSRLILSYEQLRWLLAGFFSIVLYNVLAPRLAAMSVSRRFGFTSAIALAPLVLMKFHVQIREGIALALWLMAVTANGGVIAKNARAWRFWLVALVSSAIHLSVVLWWIAALVLRSERPRYRRQALTIVLLFALYGATTTRVGSQFMAETFSAVPFFIEPESYVTVTTGKLWYWAIFILLPLLALAMFSRSAFSLTGTPHWQPTIFGLLGTYGLLGFFSVSMLGMMLWGASGTDFNLTIRVALTLLMFLCVQLALTRPRWPVTWAVFAFTLLAVVRLLFFPV